jgi:hypothetical protein
MKEHMCWARRVGTRRLKQVFVQCTNKQMPGSMFCKKHAHDREHGHWGVAQKPAPDDGKGIQAEVAQGPKPSMSPNDAGDAIQAEGAMGPSMSPHGDGEAIQPEGAMVPIMIPHGDGEAMQPEGAMGPNMSPHDDGEAFQDPSVDIHIMRPHDGGEAIQPEVAQLLGRAQALVVSMGKFFKYQQAELKELALRQLEDLILHKATLIDSAIVLC